MLTCSHLLSLLRLALLAEYIVHIRRKPGIQKTEFLIPLEADLVECIEVLRHSDFWVEEQGLSMCRLLRFEIKLMGTICSYHSKLLLKRGCHGE
jgi:hypothetical protein